jgi:hypothetical protein
MRTPSPIAAKHPHSGRFNSSPFRHLRAQVPCETPNGQGQATTWRQNSTVNVMIDPTAVSPETTAGGSA